MNWKKVLWRAFLVVVGLGALAHIAALVVSGVYSSLWYTLLVALLPAAITMAIAAFVVAEFYNSSALKPSLSAFCVAYCVSVSMISWLWWGNPTFINGNLVSAQQVIAVASPFGVKRLDVAHFPTEIAWQDEAEHTSGVRLIVQVRFPLEPDDSKKEIISAMTKMKNPQVLAIVQDRVDTARARLELWHQAFVRAVRFSSTASERSEVRIGTYRGVDTESQILLWRKLEASLADIPLKPNRELPIVVSVSFAATQLRAEDTKLLAL